MTSRTEIAAHLSEAILTDETVQESIHSLVLSQAPHLSRLFAPGPEDAEFEFNKRMYGNLCSRYLRREVTIACAHGHLGREEEGLSKVALYIWDRISNDDSLDDYLKTHSNKCAGSDNEFHVDPSDTRHFWCAYAIERVSICSMVIEQVSSAMQS